MAFSVPKINKKLVVWRRRRRRRIKSQSVDPRGMGKNMSEEEELGENEEDHQLWFLSWIIGKFDIGTGISHNPTPQS